MTNEERHQHNEALRNKPFTHYRYPKGYIFYSDHHQRLHEEREMRKAGMTLGGHLTWVLAALVVLWMIIYAAANS